MSQFDPKNPQNPYAGSVNANTPIGDPPPPGAATEGDATGGIIPYKNPKALIAYYLGILSGLPLIGFPLGIAAFVLGIMGLRDRNRNPVIKGSVHAGIGIGCGFLFTLIWGASILMILIGVISGLANRR